MPKESLSDNLKDLQTDDVDGRSYGLQTSKLIQVDTSEQKEEEGNIFLKNEVREKNISEEDDMMKEVIINLMNCGSEWAKQGGRAMKKREMRKIAIMMIQDTCLWKRNSDKKYLHVPASFKTKYK